MSGSLNRQQLILANGLRVNLIHDPGATRSAALIQLAAGSHHEPVEWPGLAHLLEHVVFAGSTQYQDEDRLMSWAQAEGARLNATTLATSTSWFLDITAAKVGEGLARLVDMLVSPLLTLEATRQEVAVIDAEYLMLSTHADTQCEAAMSLAFSAPAALQRFHVGNRAHFGDDMAALQQALRQYHHRFFTAGHLTLWLQGPQSLNALAALAHRYGSLFASAVAQPPATAPLTLHPGRYLRLRSTGMPRLRVSFLLAQVQPQTLPALTLLRQLLTDEAEQSLLALLREKGHCDALQVLLPYYSDNGAIVSVEFEMAEASLTRAVAVEEAFKHWLQQLPQLTGAQLQHYASLSLHHFHRLTAVDRLRARAFGFAPPECGYAAIAEGWKCLLAQLSPATMTRLWIAPAVEANDMAVQGFRVAVSAEAWSGMHSEAVLPTFAFYPLNKTSLLPALPAAVVPLPHTDADSGEGVLILSPALNSSLSARQAYTIQASLRAVAGHCAHMGGRLAFDCYQGEWLLQLSGNNEVITTTLATTLQRLTQPTAQWQAQGVRLFEAAQQRSRSDIAVRYLLKQLAEVLKEQTTTEHASGKLAILHWQAALYGGNSALHHTLARLLTRFPGEINSSGKRADAPQPAQACYRFPTTSRDATVLLFCPLVEQTAECLTAWRVLASLFEPRFYQQLRVEENTGYVVSCRFHQIAGVAGILFAVQSPTATVDALFARINRFIEETGEVVSALSPIVLAEKCAILHELLQFSGQDKAEQAREKWLFQRTCAPPITDASITQLTPALLRYFYQRLCQQREYWWRLSNGDSIPL